MNTYLIDFETYYDSDITVTELGNRAYAKHPQAEAYLVSVVGEGIEWVGHPKAFDWSQIKGQHWVSHNAAFDRSIFLQLGDNITQNGPEIWDCSADLAAYMHAPRALGDLAKVLYGITMDKGARDFMKGKRWGDLNDTEKERLLVYALNDSKIAYKFWKEYENQWPEVERKCSRLNREAGYEGFRVDRAKLEEQKRQLELRYFELEKQLPWVAKGKTAFARSGIYEACRDAQIPEPPNLRKDDEDFVEWLEKYSESAPFMSAYSELNRCNRFLNRVDSYLRRTPEGEQQCGFSLKYYGAPNTGRFSGENGLNIQNLEKFKYLDIDIRNNILPPEGEEFAIFDWAQIEPRVLAWVVGDMQLLLALREVDPATGKRPSVYFAHAKATMGVTDFNFKETMADIYKLAKARVLGLGYGCGAEKFLKVAWTMARLKVTYKEAVRIVNEYRAQNPLVVGMWKMCQQNIEDHWLSNEARGVNEPFTVVLPNGRSLEYFDLCRVKARRRRHKMTEDGEMSPDFEEYDSWEYKAARTAGGNVMKLYGGLLTENIVQATARDILVEGIVDILKAGYKVRFHVHDEMIIERGKRNRLDMAELKSLMCVSPSWMPDIPLDVSGGLHGFYLKD